MIKLVGKALKRNKVFAQLQRISPPDITVVVLAYIYKFFDTPPSSRWSLILFLLNVAWISVTSL